MASPAFEVGRSVPPLDPLLLHIPIQDSCHALQILTHPPAPQTPKPSSPASLKPPSGAPPPSPQNLCAFSQAKQSGH